MVDGRDALAYVIIRPGQPGDGDNNIVVEAQAMGISQQQAAYVMRELASRWDPSVPINPINPINPIDSLAPCATCGCAKAPE